MYNELKDYMNMERNMIGISEDNFKRDVTIRFNNINQGFSRFKYKTLQDKNSNGDFIGFMTECFKLNGGENSYVDFYYYTLKEGDKDRFKSLLDKNDKIFFENCIINLEKNTVYYKLTENYIPFLVNISVQETLFSTFYFTKIPCTIWSNFNKAFIIFFENEEDVTVYKRLAKKYDLDIK